MPSPHESSLGTVHGDWENYLLFDIQFQTKNNFQTKHWKENDTTLYQPLHDKCENIDHDSITKHEFQFWYLLD